MRHDNLPASARMKRRRNAQSGAMRIDAGFDAAMRFVANVVSHEAASLFAALASLHEDHPGVETFEIARLAKNVGFGPDDQGALDDANVRFAAAFRFRLFKRIPGTALDLDSEAQSDRVALSKTFLALLDRAPLAPPTPSAVLDAAAVTWAKIVAAASQSGQGHHLVLRASDDERHVVGDFAGLVAACGAPTFVWNAGERLMAGILHAELRGGHSASVVVIDGSLLVSGVAGSDNDVPAIDSPAGSHGVMATTTSASAALPWLRGLRNTYVWRVPDAGNLPQALNGLIGGSIGRLGFDKPWMVEVAQAAVPGIGQAAAMALLGCVRDARDIGAVAALARVASTVEGHSSADAACGLISASFATSAAEGTPPMRPPSPFDEHLLACDADALTLLRRPSVLAGGGRVLAFGPPGGGKSTYAQELAARVVACSGGPVITVKAANLLAKPWGATERLVAALWSRARYEGATLVADEFDSMCAIREEDAPVSGNGYLIRALTNEWLRQLDAFPDVPLIATVNDFGALDPAVRRRFQILIEVRDEMSAEQERLAWRSLLGLEPPSGWIACGAAVADVAAAAAKCRLLGQIEAAALSEAIIQAREVRLGLRIRTAKPKRGGAVH